ncbi:MAG: response regulator transcription factor [Caecibacter massiliensis]|nr:response regulator transcription factor [Caecibacter massiliensis]
MIRVLVIDDQKILLEGLAAILSQCDDVEIVGTIPFSEMVESACSLTKPDVIFMDICMEGKNSGIELTKRLKEKNPGQKIIIMTGFQDISFLEMSRDAGADSFIYKESSAATFIECMKRTVAGEQIYPDVQGNVTFGVCGVTLTERELDILRLICRNLSYQEIADELGISKRTVSFHISNMLSKTGHKSIVGLAVEAADKGYASAP